MKKYLFLVPIILLTLCSFSMAQQYETPKNDFCGYENEAVFISAIEKGEANWQILIYSLETGKLSLDMVSPPAVANYMEALANDGKMDLIPLQYFDNEEIKTAIDVVFQEPWNIPNNWNVYENHWVANLACER
jgi:hypothetical protein